MRNDEFNSLKVSNEKQVSNKEFGKLPRDEYVFKRDNVVQNKDSINDNHIKDELTNEDHHKNLNGPKKDKDIELPKSTSAGTTAGTVTSTVAAAASVIAVASVSVVAGISVIQNQSATARFLDFEIFSNRVEYALVVENTEQDNFVIEVSSNRYKNSNKINHGENFGSFENLYENETYNIIVKEDGFAGKTLINEYFTTKIEDPIEPVDPDDPTPPARGVFNGFSFSKYASYEMGTFEITLDFEEYEENVFSNFELYLKDTTMEDEPWGDSQGQEVRFDYTFQLAKTTQIQTVSIRVESEEEWVEMYLGDEFYYELHYVEDGERKLAGSGSGLTFIDSYEYGPEFYSTFEVTDLMMNVYIYYEDPNERFHSPFMRIYRAGNGRTSEINETISLEMTTEQKVDLSQLSRNTLAELFTSTFTVTLEGIEIDSDGTQKQVIWTTIEEVQFKEIEIVRPSYISDFKILDGMLMQIYVNFSDPNYQFTSFSLRLYKEASYSQGAYLDEIDEEVTIERISGEQYVDFSNLSENALSRLFSEEFTLILQGYEDGEFTEWDSQTVAFSDYRSVAPTFESSFEIENEYLMLIKLSFYDPDGKYSYPFIRLVNENSQTSEEVLVNIDYIDGSQMLDMSEAYVTFLDELFNSTFTVTFEGYEDGYMTVWQTFENVQFINSLESAPILDSNFEVSNDGFMFLTLTYTDPKQRFSNPKMHIYLDGTSFVVDETVELVMTSEEQMIDLSKLDATSYRQILNRQNTFTIYLEGEVDGETTTWATYDDSFNQVSMTKVVSIDFGDNYIDDQEGTLKYDLSYIDDNMLITSLELRLEADGATFTIPLEIDAEYASIHEVSGILYLMQARIETSTGVYPSSVDEIKAYLINSTDVYISVTTNDPTTGESSTEMTYMSKITFN